MHRSWFLLPLVPLTLWLFAGGAPLAMAPALTLLTLRLAVRRGRLGAHLEQLRWPTMTAIAAPPGVMFFSWSLSNGPFVSGLEVGCFTLFVVLCAMQVTGIASEFREGTAAQWLTQPESLRRLLAERVVAATITSLTALATLGLAFPAVASTHAFGLAAAAALGGAGVLASLSTREPVAAAVTNGVLLSAPPLLVAWLRDSEEIIDASATLPLIGWSLLLLALGFWQARRLLLRPEPTLPSLRWPGAGRTTPLKALARKELRLQVFTLVVGAFAVIALRLATLAARGGAFDASSFFAWTIGLLSGLVAISEEHHHGTVYTDALTLPASTVWRTKVVVSALATLVAAVVLPLLLFSHLHLPDGGIVPLDGLILGQAAPAVLAMSIGFAAATATRQLNRSLFVGLLVLVGVATATVAIFVSTTLALDPLIDRFGLQRHHWSYNESFTRMMVFNGLELLGCVGFLVVARRTWLTSVVPWRLASLFGLGLALVAAATSGAFLVL